MLQDHTKQNPSTNITQSLPATMVNQGQVISKETKLDSVFNATEWQNAEMNKWNDVFKSSTKEINKALETSKAKAKAKQKSALFLNGINIPKSTRTAFLKAVQAMDGPSSASEPSEYDFKKKEEPKEYPHPWNKKRIRKIIMTDN